MARSIPKGLSEVLEELELERPQLVTTSQLASLCERSGVRTPAKVVASRLHEKGWLLATPQRGVWEFAPAELAGAYSSADPLLPLKAHAAAHPSERSALASQTAAWALGLADRVPAVIDAAFEQMPTSVPDGVRASTYRPNVPTAAAKGFPALAPESIVVHMAQRPSAVRSWQGGRRVAPRRRVRAGRCDDARRARGQVALGRRSDRLPPPRHAPRRRRRGHGGNPSPLEGPLRERPGAQKRQEVAGVRLDTAVRPTGDGGSPMTREYDISIQPGHIARHTPRNAGSQGREAAVVDIAQDLLLRRLHDEGLLDVVAIKGGTAIRKLYAGNEARLLARALARTREAKVGPHAGARPLRRTAPRDQDGAPRGERVRNNRPPQPHHHGARHVRPRMDMLAIQALERAGQGAHQAPGGAPGLDGLERHARRWCLMGTLIREVLVRP